MDSPSAFGALLDADRGGSFELASTEPFTVRRRYVPDTNVLQTTFLTANGIATVTDALSLPLGGGLVPFRELVRDVEGVSGSVPFGWSVAPRFGYAQRRTRISRRVGVPVATSGNDALAVCSWDAGEPRLDPTSISGSFATSSGSRSTIALSVAHQDALVFPTRTDVTERLRKTIGSWHRWAAAR